MTPLGWLALAVGAAVTLVPTPARVRASALTHDGRLVAGPALRRGAAGVPARAGRLARPVVGVVATAVVAVVMWRGGPALALAAAVVLGVAALLARDVGRARRDERRQRALLTAVRMIAGELAAGTRPSAALEAAADTSRAAARLLEPVRAVADLRDAGRHHDTAPRVEPEVRPLVAAWQLVAATGAPLADVVERVAVDLAGRDARRRAVAVASAGPRASAMLLSVLPTLGVALGAAMGGQPLTFLLADSAGRAVCCAGVLLDAAGVLWIRRITRRAT